MTSFMFHPVTVVLIMFNVWWSTRRWERRLIARACEALAVQIHPGHTGAEALSAVATILRKGDGLTHRQSHAAAVDSLPGK